MGWSNKWWKRTNPCVIAHRYRNDPPPASDPCSAEPLWALTVCEHHPNNELAAQLCLRLDHGKKVPLVSGISHPHLLHLTADKTSHSWQNLTTWQNLISIKSVQAKHCKHASPEPTCIHNVVTHYCDCHSQLPSLITKPANHHFREQHLCIYVSNIDIPPKLPHHLLTLHSPLPCSMLIHLLFHWHGVISIDHAALVFAHYIVATHPFSPFPAWRSMSPKSNWTSRSLAQGPFQLL